MFHKLKLSGGVILALGIRRRYGQFNYGTLIEESVSGAYLSMSDEQREKFSANFAGILDFMESAFRDYVSVRGVFDDRGVADTMDSLMDADNAREQWDAFLPYAALSPSVEPDLSSSG